MQLKLRKSNMGLAHKLEKQLVAKINQENDEAQKLQQKKLYERERFVEMERQFAWDVALFLILGQQEKLLKNTLLNPSITIYSEHDYVLPEKGVHRIPTECLEEVRTRLDAEGFKTGKIVSVPSYEGKYEDGEYVPGGGGYSYFEVSW